MSKKRFFSVSIHNQAGKEIGSAALKPLQRYLTIGSGVDNDLSVTVAGVPEKHRLIEKSGSGYNLLLPPAFNGALDTGRKIFQIKDLIKHNRLKRKGGYYVVPIPGKPFSIKAEDVTFFFSYKGVAPLEKIERIDRSLKKSLIGREDYFFLLLLLISAAINFSMAGYLNTIEIKKQDHIEVMAQMPERFAKLIFKPAERKIEKKVAKAKAEEKKEEEKAEKKQEEAKKETKKESKPETTVPKEPSLTESRESVSSRVKSKGLLGVITAKEKPVFASQNIFDIDAEEVPHQPKFASVQQGAKGGDSISDTVKRLDNIELDSADRKPAGKGRDISDILKEKKVASLTSDSGKTEEKATTGGREEADIYKTVYSYSGGVKYLYNNALRKDPTLKGKITVKLTISEEGKVRKVELVSSSLKSPELEESIMNRIYKWQFSEARGSGDFVITYTFDFSPTN